MNSKNHRVQRAARVDEGLVQRGKSSINCFPLDQISFHWLTNQEYTLNMSSNNQDTVPEPCSMEEQPTSEWATLHTLLVEMNCDSGAKSSLDLVDVGRAYFEASQRSNQRSGKTRS